MIKKETWTLIGVNYEIAVYENSMYGGMVGW